MLFYFSGVNALPDSNRSIKAFVMHHCMDRCFPVKSGLTQRALDGGDSSPVSSIFLDSSFFLLPNIVHARPAASNANR
jgi:hypothetical protein